MNTDRVYYTHDAETQAKREMAAFTLLALTLGLGIGALVALLLAPSSGKKARRELAKGMGKDLKNGRDAVDPLVKQLEGQMSRLFKKAEERVTHLV